MKPDGLWIGVVFALSASACAGNQPIVPEQTQKRAQEQYGEQQMSMEGLNQTPAEQAAARHANDTLPVEQPGREDADEGASQQSEP